MEKPLTKRALRIFAVLESYRAGSPDILDALLPFFEPILAEFPGHTLDVTEFARRVSEAYRWNFTPDIVEELVPRFEAKGWVQNIGGSAKESAYRITYDNPTASPNAVRDTAITQTLLALAESFSNFISEISPLTNFVYDTNTLADMLVEWLVSIDAYTEDVLKEKALQVTKVEGQISLSVIVQESSNLTNEERYLCARFVKHLVETKSPYVGDLCRLAAIGLLTEVVQDFHKPVTQVAKTNLVAYLDGPVAMDLLGVSGKEAAENIRVLVQKLQEVGGSVRIFRASVNELQGALDAVLKRNAPERTGPTAGAIRRNEVLESYVRQVAHDPDKFLTDHKIGVTERKLDQFPNEHEYFTKEAYEGFLSRLTWHTEISRREHDATIVAHVMRMRKGVNSRDLFQTRHIAISRNALLCESAKKFSDAHELAPRPSVGPVIHQRQLAAAIWLRTGLSAFQEEIPRRYLLAACERVLELKKNVADQVRIIARTLTKEKAEQLDLLLTQDRSTQLLMDKTLGSTNVVTPNNIETLIDEMRQTIGEEFKTDAVEKIALAKRQATVRVRKANEQRRLVEENNVALSASIAKASAEDDAAVDALLGEVNRDIRRFRKIINLAAGVLVGLAGLLPLLTESLGAGAKLLCLVISGVIAAALMYFQILDRPVGLKSRVTKWGIARLNRLADERGLSAKLKRYSIEERDLLLQRSTGFGLT